MWSATLGRLIATASLVAAGAAQAPVSPPMTQPQAGGAVIRGQIVDRVTHAPVRKATVRAQSAALDESLVTLSDGDGRYEFRDLPAGDYTLIAGKRYYIDQPFGRSRAGDPARPIVVAGGQVVERADFSLIRGGVISGRVLDEFGEPVDTVIVSVLRYAHGATGRRLRTIARSRPTNDLGEYRISGLRAGRYLIAATLPDAGDLPGFPGLVLDRATYAPTYFPSTGDVGGAERVEVQLGDVVPGRDVVLKPLRAVRVSGTVVTSDHPAFGRRITLAPVGGDLDPVRVASVAEDGTFVLSAVPGGEYVARVTGGSGRDGETTAVPLTVGDSDIEGLQIAAAPPARVRGRIRLLQTPPKPVRMTDFVVQAVAVDRLGLAGGQVTVAGDGTFTLSTGVGRVVVRLDGAPAGWALDRVLLKGADVTDRGFDVPSAAGVTTVDVLVTSQLAEASLAITEPSGDAVRDCYVVIFSRDRAQWTYLSRRIATGRPTTGGRFASRLPPGDYYAVAVDDIEPGEWYDPEFLNAIVPRAVELTLVAGQTARANLTITR